MCGGYELEADPESVIAAFRVDTVQLDIPFARELYPRMKAPIIVARERKDGTSERILGLCRWGLVPPWAKSEREGDKLYNARAESLRERPSYREAFRTRRCLVPITAFFEWQKSESKSLRFRCAPRESTGQLGQFWALAGLWSTWRSPEGRKVGSFTIVTTTPNEGIAAIHDRMPVVLPEHAHAVWLGKGTEHSELLRLLVPFPDASVSMEAG
jgi:putative SOS response-associated peptidase YedK